jgi:hypothetical protein
MLAQLSGKYVALFQKKKRFLVGSKSSDRKMLISDFQS